jgi:DNA-binding response OmpR family regulator
LKRNADRLLGLINQLLDLAKLEAGKMSLQARKLDLVPYLRNLVMSFLSLAERRKINLQFDSTEDKIAIYIDTEKFEKIIVNLISNAFKFTPQQGRIEVCLIMPNAKIQMSNQFPIPKSNIQHPISNIVQITITNTGVGIPPDQFKKIFDRFYQADDSYTKNQEGTGIGLALVKELVELHHGHIAVSSENISDKKDTLTTFTILLPLGREHLRDDEIAEDISILDTGIEHPTPKIVDREPSTEKRVTSIQHPGSRIQDRESSILIIEDNPDMQQYLHNNLSESYRTLIAENGEKGIVLAMSKLPNLIVSDVMMPGMDGFTVCEKIKTDTRTSHIPLILLTARADAESRITGLETGADDYIAKPFDMKELHVRIHNLIEQRNLLRKKFSQQTTFIPEDIATNVVDQSFLQRAKGIIEEHLSDSDFTVKDFAQEIGFSRIHLYRKIHALTDHSTQDFIRIIRLQKAAYLLSHSEATVSEIAYEVGFNNLSYFTRRFREHFGMIPSKFSIRNKS